MSLSQSWNAELNAFDMLRYDAREMKLNRQYINRQKCNFFFHRHDMILLPSTRFVNANFTLSIVHRRVTESNVTLLRVVAVNSSLLKSNAFSESKIQCLFIFHNRKNYNRFFPIRLKCSIAPRQCMWVCDHIINACERVLFYQILETIHCYLHSRKCSSLVLAFFLLPSAVFNAKSSKGKK